MFDVFGDGASGAEWLARIAAVGLAASHVATVWLNGSLFARRQASLEARGEWWARLLTCRLCLSWPWLCPTVFLGLAACSAHCPPLGRGAVLVIYSLAAAHVAVLAKQWGNFER